MKKLIFVAALCGGCKFVPDVQVVEVSKVEQMIREADTNQDGTLSSHEIIALLRKLKQ